MLVHVGSLSGVRQIVCGRILFTWRIHPGIKVGITRETQVPIRWMDQGAVQALPILRVQKRLDSGKVESLLKAHMSDRTDWRKMLKNQVEVIDFAGFLG